MGGKEKEKKKKQKKIPKITLPRVICEKTKWDLFQSITADGNYTLVVCVFFPVGPIYHLPTALISYKLILLSL